MIKNLMCFLFDPYSVIETHIFEIHEYLKKG